MHALRAFLGLWRAGWVGALALGGSALVACGDGTEAAPASVDAGPEGTAGPPLASPEGEAYRPDFCARAGDDAVRDLFCEGPAPRIKSLRELEDRLGVGPQAAVGAARVDDPYAIDNLVVLLGHSTALSGRLVSPINPRIIMLGQDTFLTFQRGVQQIELASQARDKDAFNFYLLSFAQACNTAPAGCSPGDLYTPRIEADWARVEIRDDEELKNTPADCRQCHQRARERPILLMRELEGPWTHFFAPTPENAPEDPVPELTGRDLVRDYVRAKGDEDYAGVPLQVIRSTLGLALEEVMAVRARVGDFQPLVFDGEAIQKERWPYGPEGWGTEPLRSATWDRAYDAFKRGEQLALPDYEPRPTDASKQALLSDAYARYRAGAISADELPDLAEIFPDDARRRAEIGLSTEPGATPAQALIQACGSCHNDVLDQSISRARFSVALSRMDRAARELAIERIARPTSMLGAMPPPEARQLDPEARQRVIDYLRGDTRSTEDDALLERAAQLGMAGPAP